MQEPRRRAALPHGPAQAHAQRGARENWDPSRVAQLDSWSIAEDDRLDGSDNDSAIFVPKGGASTLTEMFGLVDMTFVEQRRIIAYVTDRYSIDWSAEDTRMWDWVEYLNDVAIEETEGEGDEEIRPAR